VRTAQGKLLRTLAEQYSVICKADLKTGALGRGLFAQQAFEQGDVVLSVPMDVCIIRQLDAQDAMASPDEKTERKDEVGGDGRNEKVVAGEESSPELTETHRKSMLWVVELFLSAELLASLFADQDPAAPGVWVCTLSICVCVCVCVCLCVNVYMYRFLATICIATPKARHAVPAPLTQRYTCTCTSIICMYL
jgi:hypothetical protein